METKSHIGIRIKQRRKALGISAVELAAELGMAKTTIHRYESGEISTIKLPVVEAIAHALKVDPLWLIGKSEEMHDIKRREPLRDVANILNKLSFYFKNETNLEFEGKKLNNHSRDYLVNMFETAKIMVSKLND